MSTSKPSLKPQYIVDSDGNRKAVILDIADYNALIEALEDLEDREFARDYEARKAAGRLAPDELETVPFDQAIAEIEQIRRTRQVA